MTLGSRMFSRGAVLAVAVVRIDDIRVTPRYTDFMANSADRNSASWNRLASWLEGVESLRQGVW